MPEIKLPDGKKLTFEKKVSGIQIAEKISKSLAKQALIMSVDGELKDLYIPINKDCSVKIYTAKDREGLEVIRHDTAHIMAMAVQELYPGTQVTIGPVIENGFYYDISYKDTFTPDDLLKIEKRMKELVNRDYDVDVEIVSPEKATEVFTERGEIFKLDIIKNIPKNEIIKLYKHQEYIDMCRGPHVSSVRHL